MVAPKQWEIQQIFTQTYKDVANTKVYATVDDLKTCNVENNQETVFSSGGVGNAYGAAFSHSKRITGTATARGFKNDILGLITGTDVSEGTVVAPNSEVLVVTSDAATLLEGTPVGTANEELKGVYVYDSETGERGTEIEQAATTAAGKVVLTGQSLAFFASELPDGTEVIVFYEANTNTTAQTIDNDSGEFSAIVRIEMETLVQDCLGDEYAATLIIYKAKLTGSWMIDLAADGDPATLDVSFEGMKASCGNGLLSRLIIHDGLV